MKVLIPLISILSLALAEPPVGEGYAAARSGYDYNYEDDHGHDHTNDFQRSPSQEYLPPATRSFGSSRNAVSTEYGPPSARTSSTRSGLSQTYGPPHARSGPSQQYGVPNARSSAQHTPAARALSTEYGVPSARSTPSGLYGAPAVRSGLSQEYGVPPVSSDIARTPSAQYGAPELRTPSEEYGVPSQRSFEHSPSQQYGPPAARNSQFSGNSLSQEYGVPLARSGDFHDSHTTARSNPRAFVSSSSRSFKGSVHVGARSIPGSRGAASARNAGSYSQEAAAPSQTYGAPSQRDVSESYTVASARGVSQEYGVPASRAAEHKTGAVASSYSAASARSGLSDTYGPPSLRDSMSSEHEGYSYARDGVNEELNQEPANYDFAYKVNDYESGSEFGHTETRQDNRAEGSYFVVLPDGTKQVVEYEADERGFKPRISVEPAELARSAGYDDNAAELVDARQADGPY
ncbi:uncharacterized protein LOC142984190 [Anticarsia gemmatalis]|uniref:uncharacterized protein LOC142984190 n=1 Tax=Anticarsia gemmatalis TaxID=129554 RepID=UPI003F75A911